MGFLGFFKNHPVPEQPIASPPAPLATNNPSDPKNFIPDGVPWIDDLVPEAQLAFRIGADFQVFYHLMKLGWKGTREIRRENIDRVAKCCEAFRVDYNIRNDIDSDDDRFVLVTVIGAIG